MSLPQTPLKSGWWVELDAMRPLFRLSDRRYHLTVSDKSSLPRNSRLTASAFSVSDIGNSFKPLTDSEKQQP